MPKIERENYMEKISIYGIAQNGVIDIVKLDREKQSYSRSDTNREATRMNS